MRRDRLLRSKPGWQLSRPQQTAVVVCMAMFGVWWFSAGSVATLCRGNLEPELAGNELSKKRERMELLHAELDDYFGEIISNLDHQLIPLDRLARLSLRAGQSFCEKIVQDSDDPLRRASAFCTLGHINYYRHDLQASATAYRNALELTSARAKQPMILVHSYAANHLVGALAQLGREEEALQVCARSSLQLQEQINQSSKVSIELANELAFASRNQAILLASDGKLSEATKIAERHLSILENLLEARPSEVTLAERFIDGKYLLAGLLWRHPHGARQQESLELLADVSEAATALRNDAERRMRKGDLADYGKYKAAAERANQELEIAQSLFGLPDGQLRSPSFWTRKNLYRGRRSIGTEILLDNVRMPAEFERQEAMLVKWTGRAWLDQVNVPLIRELATELVVLLLVDDFEMEEEARKELLASQVALERVRFVQVPANTLWVRDFGPLSVLGSDGFPIWIDYQHPLPESRSDNDLLIERLSRFTGHRVIRGPLYLEGGNLVGNGRGLTVCTQQLVAENLDRGFTPERLRTRLRTMIGCQELVVLDNLKREKTGHVDWFLTFVTSDTVIVGEYDRAVDPENSTILDTNATKLRQVRLHQTDNLLKVVRIPMPPHPEGGFGGSYTNVVFANGKLLVPQWGNAGKEMNADALKVYQELLPDCQIVPIDCTAMLSNSGAIHCATSNVARMPFRLPSAEKD